MQSRHRTLLSARWYLLVVAVYAVGIASLAAALRNNVGFPLDDSWIHQEIARNLVEQHSFGFTPGVSSSGSSSTLWTLILSLHYLLLPGHSPVFFPAVLNAILLIASGLMLWTLAVRDGLSTLECAALAMLPGLSGNLVWLVFTGMEHILFVAFSLLAILLWVRTGDERDAGLSSWLTSSLACGLVLALLGLTRPDGLGLGLLLLVLYHWCGRKLGDAVRAAAVAFVCMLPSFVLNLKTSHSLLPLTVKGRRYLYMGSDHIHFGRSTVKALVFETYRKVIEHNFFHSTSAWVMLAVVLAFYGGWVLLRRFPNRTSMLVLWMLLHYASFCVSLPSTGHGGRYQPFVLVLFPALLAIALFDLIARVSVLTRGWRAQPVLLQTVALGALAVVTTLTLPRWEIGLRDSIYDINHCHRAMAYWLDRNYPAGTKIGVFDIGAIAYFSHMDVIDLGGLVDPKFLPYLLSGHVPDYLKAKGAEMIILPSDGETIHFASQLGFTKPGLRLEPVHTEGIDYATWLSGNLYSQHAYQYETLYRVVDAGTGLGPGLKP